MKRKTKFILIGLVALISLSLALNFNKIKYAFTMLSLYNKDKKIEASNDELGDLDDDYLLLENPLETILANKDDDDELIYDKTIEDGNPENETIEEETIDKSKIDDNIDQSTSSNTTESSKSYISIVNNYNNEFGRLQNQFEGNLNNLISQGFEDYSSGNISKAQLASKYLSQGASLEASSDSQFKSLATSMEKELKENNHDTSVIKEIENYYTSFKNSRKSSLMSQGMSYLN